MLKIFLHTFFMHHKIESVTRMILSTEKVQPILCIILMSNPKCVQRSGSVGRVLDW